jgi:hypothetical protein
MLYFTSGVPWPLCLALAFNPWLFQPYAACGPLFCQAFCADYKKRKITVTKKRANLNRCAAAYPHSTVESKLTIAFVCEPVLLPDIGAPFFALLG